MSTQHRGSCLCGRLSYAVDGALESFYLCHCRRCRKDTGSAHASNLFSTTAKLHWLSATDGIQTYNLPGTRHSRIFCHSCGSALPSLQLEGKLLVVPAGSLDTEVTVSPTAHIFCDSRASWEDELSQARRFAELPDL